MRANGAGTAGVSLVEKKVLTTKIYTAVHTGLTGTHGPVRPVWVTLPKCKFYFTIV
jgi:hypothetical protein